MTTYRYTTYVAYRGRRGVTVKQIQHSGTVQAESVLDAQELARRAISREAYAHVDADADVLSSYEVLPPVVQCMEDDL